MEVLWDRAPLWLGHLPGAGQDLVIAFSSIGHDPARLPTPEFRATATAGGRPALFVADASRSWANAPDFAPALRHAVAVLRARQPIARIVTLGLSMGGFCALAAAEVLAADCAIALSPQFSVDPARMPDETRWADWAGRIARFTYPQAPLPARAVLCHGMEDDAAQALAFPARAGIDHFLFPGQSHSALGPHLRQSGILPGVIDAALAGDRRRLGRIMSSAGGVARKRLADQLPR